MIALIDTEGYFVVTDMFWKRDRSRAVEDFYAMPLEKGEAAFIYIGYSGLVLRTPSATVAFDIADLLGRKEIEALESLDLLLYTHGHGDHYKAKTALQVYERLGPHIVAEASVARDLAAEIPIGEYTLAEPGETYSIGDFLVTAIEGIHRGPITLYLVEMDDRTVFHGGDSGHVSLETFTADLTFLPTGKPSPTASPRYALRMANDLKPKTAVTIHGSEDQNREFKRVMKENMPQTTVIIPEEFKPEKTTLE